MTSDSPMVIDIARGVLLHHSTMSCILQIFPSYSPQGFPGVHAAALIYLYFLLVINSCGIVKLN